jgi:thiamine-phosphate pyrophosphorylase
VPPPRKFFRLPILCYVTDQKSLVPEVAGENHGTLLKRMAAVASAGVDWIQIREKDLSGKEISLLCREALLRTERLNEQIGHPTRILINDHLDVALAEHAGGVHLGEHSVPIRAVSKWLDSRSDRSVFQNFLMGVSCHSVDTAVDAARDGADYVFFGPVFTTPSKTSFGPPQGLERLARVCHSVPIPVLAIGGITRENASACLAAGAAGIAAIRLFQDANDLLSSIANLRGILR